MGSPVSERAIPTAIFSADIGLFAARPPLMRGHQRMGWSSNGEQRRRRGITASMEAGLLSRQGFWSLLTHMPMHRMHAQRCAGSC